MARYTPSGQVNTIPQIQTELENIQTAINDTVSRKGDTPNGMGGDLDMNSNRILNLPKPRVGGEPLRLGDVVDVTVTVGTEETLVVDTVDAATLLDLSLGTNVRCKRYSAGFNTVKNLDYLVVAGGTGTEDGGLFINLSNGNQLQLLTQGELTAEQFGCSETLTDAQNKTIIDAAIVSISNNGGGTLLIPSNIDYGFRLATPSTWPDMEAVTSGDVTVIDDSQANNEGSGRVGAQRRTFYGTVPTTPAGQHNGNGFQIFGQWHPYYMVTTYETQETSGLSPYRASFIARAINDTADAISPEGAVEFWGMGQRNAVGSNTNFADRTGFKIYTSNYIYDTVAGDWLHPDFTAYAIDRYTGGQAWNRGVDRSRAYEWFIPDGSPSTLVSVRGETVDELPEWRLEANGTSVNYRLNPNATNADYQLSVGGTVRTSYDTAGNTHIGDRILTTTQSEVAVSGLSEGNEYFRFIGDGFQASARYFAVSNAGSNANAAAIRVGANSTTSRSINAGGTINASGADYAEYENNNGITFAKGDVVGFDNDGNLTNKFSESKRFGVKSTNPSYVGGDDWMEPNEPQEPDINDTNYEALLVQFKTDWDSWYERNELRRQQVDRIAYSGKVPVNYTSGNVGDYLVPVVNQQDTIGLLHVTEPTFEQYRLAIGKVNRILNDGRREIAVITH